MTRDNVTVFQPYPFEVGQKIRIESGARQGDWQVEEVTEKEITLKCPLSGREFTWHRFCYSVAEEKREWPQEG